MNFLLGFIIGLLVGAVVFYYVYQNNKAKLDAVVKVVETELNESAVVTQIKEIFKK